MAQQLFGLMFQNIDVKLKSHKSWARTLQALFVFLYPQLQYTEKDSASLEQCLTIKTMGIGQLNESKGWYV